MKQFLLWLFRRRYGNLLTTSQRRLHRALNPPMTKTRLLSCKENPPIPIILHHRRQKISLLRLGPK